MKRVDIMTAALVSDCVSVVSPLLLSTVAISCNLQLPPKLGGQVVPLYGIWACDIKCKQSLSLSKVMTTDVVKVLLLG